MLLVRLSSFLKHKNLSFNKFEISLEVSHGSISNAFKHKKNIGSNVIEKILKIYPEIRAEWLLRGEGDMLSSSESSKLEKSLQVDEALSDELIAKTLRFFNFKKKSELQSFLNKSIDDKSIRTLEETILSTWEKKYGQQLKTINYQLMTIFKDKLDSEQNAKNDDSNSKVS